MAYRSYRFSTNSSYKRGVNKETVVTILVIIFAVVLLFGPLAYNIYSGVGVFGPTNTYEVKVVSKHIDHSSDGEGGSSSHYMVTTDKGTFEVQNGIFLGVTNADEIYGKMKEDKTYKITTEGNRVVGYFWQEYPYITAAWEVK